MKKNSPSSWLMRQKKQVNRWIKLSIGMALISTLVLVLQLHYLALVVDAVFIHSATQQAILKILIFIIILIGVRGLLVWLKEITGFQASAIIRERLRIEILKHLELLGPILSRDKRSGEWVSTLMEQVEALHGFFAHYLPQMWLCVLVPLVILVVVFSLNWLAGLILLITAPLIPLFMALIGMGAAAVNQKNFQALSRMSAHFLDVLQGLNTLKIFHRSRAQINDIYQVSENYRKTTMQTLRIAFLSSGALEFFAACSIALLAIYLGLSLLHDLHIGHSLTLYSALFILLLAPEFFLPLRELSAYYHARAAAVGAAEEIIKILSLPVFIRRTDLVSSPPLTAPIDIRCAHLTFSYPNHNHLVLSDLSLHIRAGEHVAIIGESGCGKSTLLYLLLGFLQSTSGEIFLNETSMSQYQLAAWHKKIGWLSQQPTLFPGSIRDNLLMGNSLVHEEDLWKVLKETYMDECIRSLPQGLDTVIGEQNLGLSGGEAQRIALARLYLKKVNILLLDEPTASLDQEHQRLLMESLHHYSTDKTLIMLTHRVETLLKMDRVLLLADGKLQEIQP